MYAVAAGGFGTPERLALLRESLNISQAPPSADGRQGAAGSPSEVDAYGWACRAGAIAGVAVAVAMAACTFGRRDFWRWAGRDIQRGLIAGARALTSAGAAVPAAGSVTALAAVGAFLWFTRTGRSPTPVLLRDHHVDLLMRLTSTPDQEVSDA
jgi:hypothetical protein